MVRQMIRRFGARKRSARPQPAYEKKRRYGTNLCREERRGQNKHLGLEHESAPFHPLRAQLTAGSSRRQGTITENRDMRQLDRHHARARAIAAGNLIAAASINHLFMTYLSGSGTLASNESERASSR